MMGTAESKSPQKRQIGIRWKLFICLASFMLVLLMAQWLLQIRLLSYFYEREKFSELQDIAEELSYYVGVEHFEDRVEILSDDKNVCIRVFKIRGNNAEEVANADANVDCMIHHLTAELLSDLYTGARENGGTYDKRIDLSKNVGEKGDDDVYLPGMHHPDQSVNAIYVRITEVKDVEYLLILNSELSPLKPVINTLQVQFSWIVLMLLFGVFLLALILSKLIATPLTKITAKAGELAAGNYNVNFEGGGYREVEELAEALSFAAKEIGTVDYLQKELIANISHDLRTPLTMVKGYSELMRDIPGENNAENAQIIIDETTRLSELVSDLLDLSKLQAGTVKPDFTTFDLTRLVRETMQRYDALVRRNGYSILFEGEDRALVVADRTMLLQVIYNLINNAVNYTGDSLRVRVSVTVKENRVRLAVADEGEGIPPDLIDQIWDRYYRVDKVHKRAVMGTGLGLSIVKSVLEAHHAEYGVESALGVGSVFWFELPLADEKDQNPEI